VRNIQLLSTSILGLTLSLFLVNSRDRTENVPAHSSRPDLLSGDDVFPPSYFEQRLKMVDALCDAMERVGAVWPIGHKVSTFLRVCFLPP